MRAYRELRRKVLKALRLLSVPTWRRGLREGVAATVEHANVNFSGEFKSVVDVGANRGQFALFALHRFPSAKLYCFEPLPDARETLESVLRHRSEVKIFPVALGSRSGAAAMHVSRREDSSSLLRPTARQTEAFPGTEEVRRTDVQLARLDDLLPTDGGPPRPCLLKIDVQGNELEVIRGGLASLELVDEILVECSFAELYEGQAQAADVVALLRDRGFTLAGVFSIVCDVRGRQLQGDLLFGRSSGVTPGT